MTDGDSEGGLRRADRRAADADPSLDQRAEHREEAAVLVLDRAAVLTLRADLGVPVEERLPRHANVLELNPAVVHPVQAELLAVVGDRDARAYLAGFIADRHEHRVDAAPPIAHDELGEDDR